MKRIYFILNRMYKWRPAIEWKYFRIEMIFFVVFFVLFPILSSVEYIYLIAKMGAGSRDFIKSLQHRLTYAVPTLLSGIVYYIIVRRALVTKKTGHFILHVILYLIGLQYFRKLTYLIVSHIAFIPSRLRKDAAGYLTEKGVNYSIVYMCMELLCVTALAYFIHAAKQEEQMRKLKEQQLITELTYLKAQLHPHFFFNTMNNIYSLALKQSAATAPLVAKLADMMRYILYEADHPKVPLQNEIQFLTNYIDAEKIRQHSNNIISLDVQGIQPGTMIEPLLLLPFIENAFKHGLHHETGNGFVKVVICQSGNELMLQVNNSKPQTIPEKPKGIGLQNAAKRLNLLYPGRYTMNVKEDANTYQLNLSLPTQ